MGAESLSTIYSPVLICLRRSTSEIRLVAARQNLPEVAEQQFRKNTEESQGTFSK